MPRQEDMEAKLSSRVQNMIFFRLFIYFLFISILIQVQQSVGWSISSGVGLCACQVHNTFETRSMSITELFPRTSFDSLLSVYRLVTGCSGKLYFFPRILIKLPLLSRKHWAAFGCKENVQPIEGTVHSYYIESLENLLQQR